MTSRKLSPQSLLDASRYIEEGCRIARDAGVVSIEASNDFDELRRVSKKLKVPLSEHFDHKYMDLLSERAFWVCGRDQNGKPRAVQALRKDELGNASLDALLRPLLKRLNGGTAKSTSPGPRGLFGTRPFAGR